MIFGASIASRDPTGLQEISYDLLEHRDIDSPATVTAELTVDRVSGCGVAVRVGLERALGIVNLDLIPVVEVHDGSWCRACAATVPTALSVLPSCALRHGNAVPIADSRFLRDLWDGDLDAAAIATSFWHSGDICCSVENLGMAWF